MLLTSAMKASSYTLHAKHEVKLSLFNFLSITPSRSIELGTRWRRVVSLTPRPLYLLRKLPDSHRTGGWVGLRAHLGAVEVKQIFPLPAIKLRPFSPQPSLTE
jgi:hypothetical protein